MLRPPEKRKTPPGKGGVSKIDCNSNKIERPQYIDPDQFHQGLISYAPLPCPVAIARQFGFWHAVYVRERGTETRVGLFDDIGAAAAAAADLNAIFAETAT